MRLLVALALFMAGPACAAPTLTAKEAAVFRSQVQGCWMLSESQTVVMIRFSLDRGGQPEADSVQMVSQGAGNAAQVKRAFLAAKRAVLRCGRGGFTLPVEKYEQWRDIELTFDPERTILR